MILRKPRKKKRFRFPSNLSLLESAIFNFSEKELNILKDLEIPDENEITPLGPVIYPTAIITDHDFRFTIPGAEIFDPDFKEEGTLYAGPLLRENEKKSIFQIQNFKKGKLASLKAPETWEEAKQLGKSIVETVVQNRSLQKFDKIRIANCPLPQKALRNQSSCLAMVTGVRDGVRKFAKSELPVIEFVETACAHNNFRNGFGALCTIESPDTELWNDLDKAKVDLMYDRMQGHIKSFLNA